MPLLRATDFADSVSAVRSHFEPGRVLPEERLPAELFVPGQMPAQEEK